MRNKKFLPVKLILIFTTLNSKYISPMTLLDPEAFLECEALTFELKVYSLFLV